MWAQAPAPATPAVLIYENQPLKLEVACRAADFEAASILCSEEEPCRLFLELAVVEAIGPRILVAGNIHTPATTLAAAALLSDDAGATWREPVARVPAAGFEAAQFLSDQLGWIAVQPQGQFPTDPYVLATTDGGAKWSPQRVWTEEGRSGLWQHLHFDSKDHGFALIDRTGAAPAGGRYELYETPNAGATWMLRESSSRPITPKWPPRRPPDWRLREDARLKTYELERRVGDSWRRMANFRTELGVCKQLEGGNP